MTHTDGWVAHPIPYTDTPTMTALYNFGLNLPDRNANINLQLQNNINSTNLYGQYYPDLSAGSQQNDQFSVKFQPVNALPFYWMLGKVSGTTTKTIINMDGLARKPRIATFSQVDSKKWHNYANVFGSLSLEFNESFLQCSLIGKGLSHGSNSLSPTFSYPSSVSSTYNNITVCTWSSTSLSPYRLKMDLQQNLQGFIGSDGFYQEISEFAPIIGTYNMQFLSDDGEALVSDFENQEKRSFVWKIVKPTDPTKYLQFTADCMIKSLLPARIHGQETVWSAVMLMEDISVESVDGLLDSFYGL
ncbi:hypothetical protein [Candidatus Lokiarchaeum ossiferum]|uniref:hypothetical protein n=1 Tax=Candidatus Lokiarchaeum ossiferum TaxID=2951803 RepID=UPI00352F67A1